ncbi:hypothetical protein F5Y08DRAFT_325418 [Xylaria arbuscula]|nr:hypothetical protein F5Y08DRAFT_325418 [Xylaria arbuscula]
MLKDASHGMKSDGGSVVNPQSTLPSNNSAPQGQYQPTHGPPTTAFSSQLDIPIAQGSGRSGPYDLSVMGNALPQSGYRALYSSGQQHQRYTHAGGGIIPQMVSFPSQPHMSHLQNQQYYLPQNQQFQPYYNAQVPPAVQHQQQQQLGSLRGNVGMGYYPGMISTQSQVPLAGYYYQTPSQYSAQTSPTHGHLGQSHLYLPDLSSGDPRTSSPLPNNNNNLDGSGGFGPGGDSTKTRPSIVRGPPRKPRQSGHAIWIGNLPPQADLMNLVQHICREATGLESLFLIAKSNCAFANFKDEASCVSAQQKLHDSKFQNVRLVSRLRKNTVEGSSGQTAPTGPAAISSSAQSASPETTSSSSPEKPADLPATKEAGVNTKSTPVATGSQQRDKFFILKSLTVEDLDLSVQNGVWATQSHNEETLNEAFGVVDNVYLIFSANKSGEYFGYARMISQINDDPAAAIEFAPRAQATNSMDLPKAIPTQATESCPRGRIIDDSARGTIFWEVERDEADGVSDAVSEDSETRSTHDGDGAQKAWGKPFKLEWLSTTRLPFYKTRGLRNPWNSNREVKIARDGTELEPTVGRKLIGLFARVQSPAALPTMGIAPGYPPQVSQPFPH